MPADDDLSGNNNKRPRLTDQPRAGVARQMQFSTAQQATLKQRARRLAMVRSEVDELQQSALQPYVCFRLGDTEKYGISQEYIDEVLYLTDIAQIPCTPSFIAGVINRRGQVIPVLDIRQFFSVGTTEPGEDARIIVLQGHGMTPGIIVDEILGTDVYQPRSLEPALPSAAVSKQAYVQGIHQGTITMLDIDALLGDQDIMVNNADLTV